MSQKLVWFWFRSSLQHLCVCDRLWHWWRMEIWHALFHWSTNLSKYSILIINHCLFVYFGFKYCWWCVADSRWSGFLTKVPAGNKAKHLLSVNHATKTINYHSNWFWKTYETVWKEVLLLVCESNKIKQSFFIYMLNLQQAANFYFITWQIIFNKKKKKKEVEPCSTPVFIDANHDFP